MHIGLDLAQTDAPSSDCMMTLSHGAGANLYIPFTLPDKKTLLLQKIAGALTSGSKGFLSITDSVPIIPNIGKYNEHMTFKMVHRVGCKYRRSPHFNDKYVLRSGVYLYV